MRLLLPPKNLVDKNRITKTGHKDTHCGFDLLPILMRDQQLINFMRGMAHDWTDNGVEYFTPLWHQELLQLAIEGKYRDLIRDPKWRKANNLREVVDEDGFQYPLWFNTARNMIAQYFARLQKISAVI